MEVDSDPFDSIAVLCEISSSQEEYLNNCPFGLPKYYHDGGGAASSLSFPDEFPVDSTAITMVSPPQTPKDNQMDEKEDSALPNRDVFQTPPEEPVFLSTSSHNNSQVEQQQVIVDRRIEAREKDLGFTAAAELMQRIEIESHSDSGNVFYPKNTEGKASKKELLLHALDGILGESSINRSKFYDSNKDDNLGLVTPQPNLTIEVGKSLERLVKSAEKFILGTPGASLGTEAVKGLERLAKSVDVLVAASIKAKTLGGNLVSETERRSQNLGKPVVELGSKGAGCSNHGLRSLQTEQIEEMEIETDGGDMECSGERLINRKLAVSIEAIESELEENNAVSRFAGSGVQGINREREGSELNGLRTAKLGDLTAEGIDDLDKSIYVSPSGAVNACGDEKDFRGKRMLPASICGRKENEGAGEAELDDVSQRNSAGIKLLNVLNMLLEDYQQDQSVETLSILEAAKRRGITFP